MEKAPTYKIPAPPRHSSCEKDHNFRRMDFGENVLALDLGLTFSPPETKPKKSTPAEVLKEREPALALSLSGESYCVFPTERSGDRKMRARGLYTQESVMRERLITGGDKADKTERISSRVSDEDDDGSNSRKKLRLTRAQSALLEESFGQQSTLNPIQKQDLARELKLTPRQVEVWFQNRRARTKLKQTEVDCELLKHLCESLTEENRRLQQELRDLKAIHSAQPLYVQFPVASLTMCLSCERRGPASTAAAVPETAVKSSFLIAAAPKQRLPNPSVSRVFINH